MRAAERSVFLSLLCYETDMRECGIGVAQWLGFLVKHFAEMPKHAKAKRDGNGRAIIERIPGGGTAP
jgi:hypothetical protein